MLTITVRGKNLEITESLRTLVEGKLGRLDHYDEGLTEAIVELTAEKTKSVQDRNHVDVSLLASGNLIVRAEARGVDMRTAVDNVAEIVQKQLIRHKERLQDRVQISAAKTVGEAISTDYRRDNPRDEPEARIMTEQIDVKPMSVDDAVEEMRTTGREWMVFINSELSQVNVLAHTGGHNYVLYIQGRRGVQL
jgi:putative sigma-54 modulation protein